MVPSVGISSVAVVLPRFVWGKCPKDNQEVTLKVALEDLFRDPISGEEGKRSVKTGSMNRGKSNPILEKGHSKHIEQCQVPQGMNVLIGGMRNSNACVDW